MRKILHFLLFTSCTLFTGSLRAQTYPVQGNAFLIPPYSLRLSDYATSTSERLAVNVLLTDVTRAELRVRFRLHIEGPTISVDTKPEYIGSAIVLQGGISLRLTNLDLSEYFSFRNLNFTGISEREFLQKGTLPEGLYRICFDVLEYNRGVKIAQSICAQAFLALNAPPIINLPRQGETLRAQMPQNVIMQWTPRHTGSPNSAFNTQYEIRVVEVWPSDRNPNDAILTQPSIYETTTTNTTLIYGPDATQLEPGRTYALRVRAVPMGEADQLDLFTNNGYSETVSFVYGQTCKPPAAVTGKVTGPHTSTLDWLQDNNHTAYKIHLRKQGSHDWRLHRSNITTIDLKDLDANTNYEYEVGAVCGDFESPYSALGTLKTMEAQTPLYDCGAKPKGQLNTNQEPLPELKVGDKVHTLTVEVTITKVTGGNGTFSGEAEARLKIFNKALMSLVFKDIRVNKDYWLIGGYFEAVNGRVELPKGVQEGVDLLGDVLSESQGGGTSNDYKTPPPDPNTFAATEMITIPDGIQSITKDERTGQVTVTDTKGVKHVLPQGKDVAVADENGKGALVDKHGQVTNTTAEQAKAAAKREYGFSIVFEKATESKAGFDTYDKKTTALKNTYETIDQYHVPWKAIGTSADAVKGSINFGTAKDLVFEQEGAKLTYNEFSNILTVNPAAAGSTAHVIVKEKTGDKEKIRGKLNVVGYTPITKTVHIIPVNNAASTVSEADLKKYLDDVYGQALVSWQVDLKNKIAISLTGDFDDGASGLLSTYTADMRKVIKAYGKLENDQYYLFLIEQGKNKTGYMPRGKRAGFIFLNNQNAEEFKHTIAHELGHGAFTLRHPFAEYPAVTAKSTDNLMDYAGGTHLYKWQWDQIHNPAAVIGLFEKDEDSQEAIVNNIEQLAKFKNEGSSLTFLSIAGKPLTLNGKLTQVSFSTSEDQWNTSKDFFPLGALCSFEVDKVKYVARKEAGSRNFLGYAGPAGNFYSEALSHKGTYTNVLVGNPCIEGGKLLFKVFPTDYLDSRPANRKVSVNNKGEGTEENVFFLKNNLTRETEAVSLYAQMKPFSDEEIFFLDKYSDDGNISGMNALYAFKSAYFIRTNPGLTGCLRDAEKDAQAGIHNSIIAEMNLFRQPAPSDETRRVVSRQGENEAYATKYKRLYEQRNFQEYFNKVLEQYKKIIDNSQHSYSSLSTQEISDIVSFFDLSGARGRLCLLRNIPLGLRLEILKKRAQWSITTGKESLLLDVIETTPDKDIEAILNYLKDNNFQQLWALYGEINGGNIDRMAAVISYFVLQKIPGKEALNNPPGETTPPLTNRVAPYIEIYKNGRVTGKPVSHTITAIENGAALTLRTTATLDAADSWGKNTYIQQFSGNPYGYVYLTFRDDYRFPLLGGDNTIKAGDRLVVPMFWAYWLVKRQETVQNWAYVRLVADVAVVVTAGATLNPTPLLLLDAVVAAVDIGFTIAEDRIASSGDNSVKEISKLWDTFYTTYGLASLVTGAAGSVRRFQFNGETLTANINQLRNRPQELEKLADDFYKLVNSAQKFQPVGNTRNLAYSMLLSAWLRIKIATFSRTAEGTELLVQGAYSVVAKSGSHASIIMNMEVIGEEIIFTNLRWCPEAGEISQVTGRFLIIGNYRYRDRAGRIVKGELETVKLTNGQSYVREVGKGIDDIYSTQKNIVDQWKNKIAGASNIQKGNFGEMASDVFLIEKGFQPLHTRLQNINAPTRQGIDGVYKKGNEYLILESKYKGTATLSTLTGGTKQMSDTWIKGGNRLVDAVGEVQAQEIIDTGYRRILAEVAPDGSVIYKELDANANEIGTFIP